jgi:phosphatidylethanolamine/phosphatidyl-N-methylethanolamine N-methyltransferase
MLDQQTLLNAYRRNARLYNVYFGWILNPGRKTAVELAVSRPGSRILEVGVGTGLSLSLYPKHVKVTGIDVSPEMLKQATELKEEMNLDNVESLQIMNAEEMTFPDNSFDCVVAMHVATVVPHPKKFADEMRRVCKPGGRIILANYFHQPGTLPGFISKKMGHFSKYIGFTPTITLDDFLEESKLEVTNKVSVNLFNVWSVLIVDNKK